MHINIDDLIDVNSICCIESKVASENNKRFEILLEEKFIRFKIDDCLINSKKIEKCDFGFYRKLNEDFYFVELKGKQISKALDQIISTINYFENNLIKIPKNNRFGFIICSKVPKAGTDVKNLIQKFKKSYGKDLKIKSNVIEYKPNQI